MSANGRGKPASDLAVWCDTCGHSHHSVCGRLAEGRERCGTTLSSGPLSAWRSWAVGRPLHLTPAGRAALSQGEET